MREFVEGFVINTVAHTFISPTHAQTIVVARVSDTRVKMLVTTSVAVEHLFAHILLGWVICTREAWQIHGSSIRA